MKRQPIALLSFAVSIFASTQVLAQTETIEFGGLEWDVRAERAERVSHKGQSALAIEKGRLWADQANFGDGVISFKVAYPEHRAFIGMSWRDQGRINSEEIYFRPHLNNKPDSIQYTPVNNRNSAWQIFSDGNAIGPINHRYDDWNDVKIVVEGDRADIYFNSDTPILHIPDLKNDLSAGGLVLRSANRTDDTTYFADLMIRALANGEGVVGTPKPGKPVPNGLIESWSVSSPFDEAIVDGHTWLPKISDLTWQDLTVETNGIANLSRLSNSRTDGNTVLVRKTLTAANSKTALLQFGFSDRVKLYLNGDLIYSGNDGYQTRDYRFLGLVGFHDTVGLNLKAGDNELVAAVSETFGGWGWAGALVPDEDPSGP